jgi:hypothetical protein
MISQHSLFFPIAARLTTQKIDKCASSFPENTMGLHMAFSTAAPFKLAPLFALTVPLEYKAMNHRSPECFRHMFFGKRFEDIAPQGENRVKEWMKVQRGFAQVDSWFAKNGRGGPFIMRDIPSFSDFAMGGYSIWPRNIFGYESQEWKDIMLWNGGRRKP